MSAPWEPWSEAARDGRLLLRHCPSCDRWAHPARPRCAGCGAEAGWAAASGVGVIDAWTVVRRSPGPGFDPPYVVARVRLAEGPVLLTNLPGTGPYRCGAPVTLAWRDALPVFVPPE